MSRSQRAQFNQNGSTVVVYEKSFSIDGISVHIQSSNGISKLVEALNKHADAVRKEEQAKLRKLLGL